MYTCIYIYVYIYMYLHINTYVYIYICISICSYICICIHIYVYIYVLHVRVYIHVIKFWQISLMHVLKYVCIYFILSCAICQNYMFSGESNIPPFFRRLKKIWNNERPKASQKHGPRAYLIVVGWRHMC